MIIYMYIPQCLIFSIGEEFGLTGCYSKAFNYLIGFRAVSRSLDPRRNLSGSISCSIFSAQVFFPSFHALVFTKCTFREGCFVQSIHIYPYLRVCQSLRVTVVLAPWVSSLFLPDFQEMLEMSLIGKCKSSLFMCQISQRAHPLVSTPA